jgi:thioredoxin 1
MTKQNLKNVTKDDWDKEILKSELPVVVDFWAEWCWPCKMVEPIFEKLAEKYKDKIKFVRVNVDEEPEISQMYGIMSIPTFIILKNGKEIDRMIGAAPKEILEKFIQQALI